MALRNRMITDHIQSYESCYEKPLPTEREYLIACDNDPLVSKRKMELEYSMRRFEIDDMTHQVLRCGVCTHTETAPGLFSESASGSFQSSTQRKKYIYRRDVPVNNTECPYKYVYLYRNQTQPGDVIVTGCKNCTEQLTNAGGGQHVQPSFSDPAGFSHGVARPACLKGLSFAEEAMISIIQPAMAVSMLKKGGCAMKGHVAFFNRSTSVDEVATTLPRLPAEIQVMELRRLTGVGSNVRWREFKCRRHKVEAALRWLMHHSPAYSDVALSLHNLRELPVDGQVTANVVQLDEEDKADDDDCGPAPGQFPDAVEQQDEIEATHSGTVVGGQVRATAAAEMTATGLTDLLQRAGGNPAAATAETAPTFAQPRATSFIDWKETPYFFAKSFPTLFMPDKLNTAPMPPPDAVHRTRAPPTSDIPAEFKRRTVPRHRSLEFIAWTRHLMHAADGRYSAHPTFAFALLNLKQRAQTAASTSFAVKQLPGEQPLDLSALRQMLQDGAESIDRIARKMTAWTKGVSDSPAYWWARRQELGALVRDKLFHNDELPFSFHTGSMAEYHMPGLWRCIELKNAPLGA